MDAAASDLSGGHAIGVAFFCSSNQIQIGRHILPPPSPPLALHQTTGFNNIIHEPQFARQLAPNTEEGYDFHPCGHHKCNHRNINFTQQPSHLQLSQLMGKTHSVCGSMVAVTYLNSKMNGSWEPYVVDFDDVF